MRVGIVPSGMSGPEHYIEVEALPRPGDHIQIWSHDSKTGSFNYTVKSVMFIGQNMSHTKKGYSHLGIIIHCEGSNV